MNELSFDGFNYFLNKKQLFPEESQKIINHSPDGFNHGYGGSGPSQLALAIMLELTGNSLNYQTLKRNVISKLPFNEKFNITFEI